MWKKIISAENTLSSQPDVRTGRGRFPRMCPDGRPGGHPVYTPLKMCREAGIRYCKFFSLGVMFLPRLDR